MEGQIPGDTLVPPRFAVARRASTCFPGLKEGAKYDATLIEVEWLYGAESSSDTTFSRILNAVAESRGQAAGRIHFKDTFVLNEGIATLQAHFDPTACPEFKPIVGERSTPVSDTTKNLFVPHKIYYARSDIELNFAEGTGSNLESRVVPAG